jgi:hypothetical protein
MQMGSVTRTVTIEGDLLRVRGDFEKMPCGNWTDAYPDVEGAVNDNPACVNLINTWLAFNGYGVQEDGGEAEWGVAMRDTDTIRGLVSGIRVTEDVGGEWRELSSMEKGDLITFLHLSYLSDGGYGHDS